RLRLPHHAHRALRTPAALSEHFDGDFAPEPLVDRTPHDSHAAGTDLRNHTVVRDPIQPRHSTPIYAAPAMPGPNQLDLFSAAKPAASAESRENYVALVEELSEHDRRYYVDAAPTISDVEYDKLLVKLRAIEGAHPDWVVAWSPTKRVGYAPVSEFPKVE